MSVGFPIALLWLSCYCESSLIITKSMIQSAGGKYYHHPTSAKRYDGHFELIASPRKVRLKEDVNNVSKRMLNSTLWTNHTRSDADIINPATVPVTRNITKSEILGLGTLKGEKHLLVNAQKGEPAMEELTIERDSKNASNRLPSTNHRMDASTISERKSNLSEAGRHRNLTELSPITTFNHHYLKDVPVDSTLPVLPAAPMTPEDKSYRGPGLLLLRWVSEVYHCLWDPDVLGCLRGLRRGLRLSHCFANQLVYRRAEQSTNDLRPRSFTEALPTHVSSAHHTPKASKKRNYKMLLLLVLLKLKLLIVPLLAAVALVSGKALSLSALAVLLAAISASGRLGIGAASSLKRTEIEQAPPELPTKTYFM